MRVYILSHFSFEQAGECAHAARNFSRLATKSIIYIVGKRSFEKASALEPACIMRAARIIRSVWACSTGVRSDATCREALARSRAAKKIKRRGRKREDAQNDGRERERENRGGRERGREGQGRTGLGYLSLIQRQDKWLRVGRRLSLEAIRRARKARRSPACGYRGFPRARPTRLQKRPPPPPPPFRWQDFNEAAEKVTDMLLVRSGQKSYFYRRHSRYIHYSW